MNSKKFKDVIYPVREIANLKDMVDSSCKLYGDNGAFLVKDKPGGEYRPISYNQFGEEVNALGTKFIEMGLKGKKIAAYYGCLLSFAIMDWFLIPEKILVLFFFLLCCPCHIDRLFRIGIDTSIKHGSGQCHRCRRKILHLLWVVAHFTNVFRQLNGFLQSRARMTGHEIGD